MQKIKRTLKNLVKTYKFLKQAEIIFLLNSQLKDKNGPSKNMWTLSNVDLIVKQINSEKKKIISKLDKFEKKWGAAETIPSEEENIYLNLLDQYKQLNEDLATIESNRSYGLPADHVITMQIDREYGLDAIRIIDGICQISKKEYELHHWNCTSTALYALLQGLPDDMNDKKLAKYAKKLDPEQEKISRFTPWRMKKVSQYLQKKMIAYKMEHLAKNQEAYDTRRQQFIDAEHRKKPLPPMPATEQAVHPKKESSSNGFKKMIHSLFKKKSSKKEEDKNKLPQQSYSHKK